MKYILNCKRSTELYDLKKQSVFFLHNSANRVVVISRALAQLIFNTLNKPCASPITRNE